MYVDESGDPGLTGSPTRFFTLSGLVVHELRWRDVLNHFLLFRRRMRASFGLKLREEIHAARFIAKPGSLQRIPRKDRLTILRHFADEIARVPDVAVINVCVDKQGKAPTYDVHEQAWMALIQRFENTITHRNFPGPTNPDDRGMIFPDGQPVGALQRLIRRMRVYNPIPSMYGGYRMLQLVQIVEDPSFRDSANSLYIQAADLCAYLAYQLHAPNQYMRKSGGSSYFRRLSPVLCRAASKQDPFGIVHL